MSFTVEDLSSVVRAAQRGEADAFGELVRRFQDIACASAYALLGDYHLAQDAAQEAFLQAYVDLPTLRDPAAFPGWFRRIVFKHGDRLVRGKRIALVGLDDASAMLCADPEPSSASETRELRQLVRAEIGRLPEHERVVVALFYLGAHTQTEISGFLDIPLSTVKKRLHDARKRLLGRLLEVMRDTLDEHRPSHDDHFVRKVQFLIAVSAGDADRTKRLLEQETTLAQQPLTSEDWRHAEAGHRQSLPMRWGYTALHLAATYGYTALVDVLLANNADVDAITCGETPLHRAVMVNDSAMIALLLRSGADVDAVDRNGMTALERAVIKGHRTVTQFLLAHGAKVDGHDAFGRSPLHWAALKGDGDLT